ncbi:MAG: pentapeptide repeat-containing protein [Okeania sp. SIO1H6]|nr:pentapeptide repeat-containing protein [Okeania sp. SIO1H6]
MAVSNDSSDIIKRIQSGELNDSDLESLRQLLQNNDNETLQQLGKFNVSIDEGKEIHIGDRNYFNWNDEAIQAVVEVVQQGKAVAVFNPTGKVTIYNYYNYYREETTTASVDTTEETDNLPCPYRGLFSFGPEDAKYFFGREVFIKKLYQATQTRNFIPVLGASGSGKSSVVFAGLVPKLQQEGNWQFTYFRPGFLRKKDKQDIPDPFYALATALVPLYTPQLNETKQLAQANELADFLRSGQVLLSDVISKIQQNYPNSQLLLIADQFEEIYTVCESEKIRRQFLDILIDNIYTPTSNSPLVLVLTMRADFLGNALSYNSFAEVLNSDIKLGGMSHKQLREVIEKPAELLGVEFEPGLVESILDDVEDAPGNLPLLEFALTELWKRRKGKQITHDAYQEIGKVQGALTRHADSVFSKLSLDEKQRVRGIFIQLVNPGDGTEGIKDTRRRVTKSELGESNWNLVTKLAGQNCRLVVTSQNANQQETVEVVHEALIRDWHQLRDWVNESREIIRNGRKIEARAKEWEDKGRKGYTLHGRQLRDAKEFQKEKAEQFELSSLAKEFIKVSINSEWKNRIKLVSILMMPIVIVSIILFPDLRQRNIENIKEKLKSGEGGKRELEYLVAGCDVKHRQKLPRNLANFFFGNCVDLFRFEFPQQLYLMKANLDGAKLSEAFFRHPILQEANLNEANLYGAKLMGANLMEADLSDANLNEANLREANLYSTNLSRAKLFRANLMEADLMGADLMEADLRQASFSEANLWEADLSYANLEGANLEGADLSHADLSHADLTQTQLWEADFNGAKLTQANLEGADFRKVTFRDRSFGQAKNLTPEQVKSACNWQKAKFDPEFLDKLNKFPDPEEKPDCSIWEDDSP